MALRSTAMHRGRHCAVEEIGPEEASCGLCGFAGARRRILTIQRAPDVFLLDCPDCRGASASRMPLPETLASYYSSYYHSHREDAPKITFDDPSGLAAHVLRLAGMPRAKEYRILDFGGGDGSLAMLIGGQTLAAGAAKRCCITLVDYAAPSPSGRADLSIEQFDSLSKCAGRQYDLVLASSILEHLPGMRSDLKSLFGLLAPGARFYARTPWIAPLFRWFEKAGLSFDFTYPAHVHDLGRDFWSCLPQRFGLDEQGISLVRSAPSPVETGIRQAPLRTLAAHLLKAPSHVFLNTYNLVGGWEVLLRR